VTSTIGNRGTLTWRGPASVVFARAVAALMDGATVAIPLLAP
jgi:hypothetical protein